MIRLIASDMDGTLLNDNKELPPDFYDVLDRLQKKGVHFVIASGRSYTTLKINFDGHMEQLDFICDNGAYVVVNGRLVSMSILDPQRLSEMIDVCIEHGACPVLCGVNGTYFENRDDVLYEQVKKYYLNFTRVDDIRQVRDDIFKVAVFDRRGVEKNSYPVISKKFADDFTAAVSGPLWMDIMNKGINKGAALDRIRRELNISREDTMAFGDYFNDAELIGGAGYGFVMANAHPDMFRYGKYRAEDNNSCGVTKAIKEYVLNE